MPEGREGRIGRMGSICVKVILLLFLALAAADQVKMLTTDDRQGSTVAPMGRKAHFVLVHGFGSGAWSWYKIRSLLEAYGHKVTSLDLKSAGIDPTPADSVRSFEDYNRPLLDFFEHHRNEDVDHCGGKVILVGHSAGGLSVTQATYLFGHKIRVAVYVAATMLKHGLATQQDIIDGVPGAFLSPPPPQTSARQGVDHHPSNNTAAGANDIDQIIEISYHKTPSEDAILAKMLHRPGPLKVLLEDARFSARGASAIENVPRVYIKTKKDRVLMPFQQEKMINRWPPSFVFSLDADHEPLTSTPFQLANILTQIAYSYCAA